MRGRALVASGAVLLAACSGGDAAEAPSSTFEREPAVTTLSPEAAQEALRQEAEDFHWRGIEALSAQIMEGPTTLKYLPDVCLSWYTEGGILAMRNPVLFEYKEGNQSVTIIPFTAAVGENIQVSKGIYVYNRQGELGTKQTYHYPSDIDGATPAGDVSVVISESVTTATMAEAQVSFGGINDSAVPGAYLVDAATGGHIMDSQTFHVTNAAETTQALSNFCDTDRFIPFKFGDI